MVQVMGDAGCWILLGLSLLPIAVLGKWPPRGARSCHPQDLLQGQWVKSKEAAARSSWG